MGSSFLGQWCVIEKHTPLSSSVLLRPLVAVKGTTVYWYGVSSPPPKVDNLMTMAELLTQSGTSTSDLILASSAAANGREVRANADSIKVEAIFVARATVDVAISC